MINIFIPSGISNYKNPFPINVPTKIKIIGRKYIKREDKLLLVIKYFLLKNVFIYKIFLISFLSLKNFN